MRIAQLVAPHSRVLGTRSSFIPYKIVAVVATATVRAAVHRGSTSNPHAILRYPEKAKFHRPSLLEGARQLDRNG